MWGGAYVIPYEQLEADVYYLGRKGDLSGVLAKIEGFAASADGDDRLRAELLRAQALHTMGRLSEAIPLYRAVLAGLPNDARAQAICGVELLAAANTLGDFDLAESVAQQALALIRRHPEASVALERIYVGYALLQQLRGDYQAAIDWYRKALRRLEDPTDHTVTQRDRTCGVAWTWYGLTKCYIALGDLVKARFAIDGIRCDPRNRTAAALAALAEFRFHFRLRALDLAENWLASAAEFAQDVELGQDVLLGRAQLADARGDSSAVRSLLEQLEASPVPLTFEVRKGIEALGLREGVQ